MIRRFLPTYDSLGQYTIPFSWLCMFIVHLYDPTAFYVVVTFMLAFTLGILSTFNKS